MAQYPSQWECHLACLPRDHDEAVQFDLSAQCSPKSISIYLIKINFANMSNK